MVVAEVMVWKGGVGKEGAYGRDDCGCDHTGGDGGRG